MSEQEIKRKANGCTFVVVLLIIAGIAFAANSCSKMGSEPRPTNLAYNEMTDDMRISVMTYAQKAIEDYVAEPRFSSSLSDYAFVRTGNRYKVEGKVNGYRFAAIIEWDYMEDKYFTLKTLEIDEMQYK